MFNKIKRIKWVANMIQKVLQIDYSNKAIACIQLNALEEECTVALLNGIINMEDCTSVIKALEDAKEKTLRG